MSDVIFTCILCVFVCVSLRDTFHSIQKRANGVRASLLGVLAAIMGFLAVFGPISIFVKSSTIVVSETRYLITSVQMAENNDELELVVVNDEGIEGNVTICTTDIQSREESDDYLVIREYKLWGPKYAIEYSSQSSFAKLFKTHQFQNEIRNRL